MMYGDGRFLSIGQMARYSGISEKTLRYYDQIGLLQPARRSEGAGYRYYDRIQSRETYIFFLRRASEPDTPYYTLEVEPGGTIRQHRTYLDEETGIEQIRGFLREWQKIIKQRLTQQEKELAKISKVKREENLEELKRKNNTRVLQGLLEDFMEAV